MSRHPSASPSTPTLLNLLLLTTTLLILPALAQRRANTTVCPSVHVILARGNDEPYPGRQGALATELCSRFTTCDYEDIVYDDPDDPVYCHAVNDGARTGRAQIEAYHEACPDTTLILSGYSQGGQVMGDILGGGGGEFYDGCRQRDNEPLERGGEVGRKIAAVLIWADIRHTANQSYNIASGADRDGEFPRPRSQLDGMNRWADIMRSWCVETDPVCARGSIFDTHKTYFDNWAREGSDWAEQKVKRPTVYVTTTVVVGQPTGTAAAGSGAMVTPPVRLGVNLMGMAIAGALAL